MGRIKTTLVKRVTEELIERHRQDCKPDFESDKKMVSELTTVSSKKLRNTIAGYVARLAKTKEE